jgi:Ca-activated chloride channel family protein
MIALALLQAAEAARGTGEARLHLWGDYYLSDPGFLWLAPAALAFLWYGRSRRGIESGRVPSLPSSALPRTLAQHFGWIPPLLQASALLLVVFCLARPVRGNAVRTTVSEGIDIVLAIDRSSSMKYPDLEEGRTRLDVIKDVVGEFAKRRMTDRVGAADNCALLTFAQFPQLLCPFTLDEGAFSSFLKGLEIVKTEAEDGTAIGRGLAKAVALLKDSDAKSKVVVLLTDGENNVEDITPAEATELAVQEHVKVYTVLAARYAFQEDIFGRIYPTNRELDSSALEDIAKKTDGYFFRVKDRNALDAAYKRIEELERTERREERYTETFDLYAQFLLAALASYVAAWISYATWARRLP